MTKLKVTYGIYRMYYISQIIGWGNKIDQIRKLGLNFKAPWEYFEKAQKQTVRWEGGVTT